VGALGLHQDQQLLAAAAIPPAHQLGLHAQRLAQQLEQQRPAKAAQAH
jgi:hypothetical protein